MCSGRVVRRGRWLRWKRAWSRKDCASARVVQAMQGCRRQPVPPALPLRLRRLQPITQRHQFIHLGDDAVLFGEGWEGNGKVAVRSDMSEVDRRVARAVP